MDKQKKPCFSCGEAHNSSEVSILQKYKEIAEKTGAQYWFYKIEGQNETQISTADDFNAFKKNNTDLFKKGKVEFRNILEFRGS